MFVDAVLLPLFIGVICAIGLGALSVLQVVTGLNRSVFPFYCWPMFGLFWVGLVSVLINFFAGIYNPVTYLTLAATACVGVALLTRQELRHIGILACIGLLLVPVSATMHEGWDAGLYHLPQQLWIRDEPIVFGLPNLHGRMGFSSFLEYINAPLWFQERFKFLAYSNATFFIVFFGFVFFSVGSQHVHLRAFAALSAASLVLFSGFNIWGFVNPDTPAGILYCLSFALGVHLLTHETGDVEPERRTFEMNVFLFMFFGLMSVMVKLSSMVIVGWVFFVLSVTLIRGHINWRSVAKLSLLPLVVSIVWLIRGVVQSGCFFYPVAKTCLDVSWNAELNAVNDANWVTAWGRHPKVGWGPLENWDWLREYWLGHNWEFLLNGLGAVLLLTIVSRLGARFFGRQSMDGLTIVGAVSITALALWVWFFKAPVPRFGVGLFMTIAPVVVLSVVGSWTFENRNYWRYFGIALIVLGAVKIGQLNRVTLDKILTFNLLAVRVPDVVPAKNFGTRAIKKKCYLVKHCAPYTRPKPYMRYGYWVFEPDKMQVYGPITRCERDPKYC